jgi:transcriptional antiterminator
MSRILKKINQLERIHTLISLKATGTPSELAKKMATSERNIYNLINEMRDLGGYICYCRFRQSYYYEEAFAFPYKLC